ncbi:MAG: hypothetical protein GY866_22780 [Proteobacteria bacterium]|nr:hypothetical protein [Pseudomonadota bacterium]
MLVIKHLKKSIPLNDKQEKLIGDAVSDGARFFNEYNENRLKLAISTFTEDMKKALFEIVFFLHVNDPKFEQHEYEATIVEDEDGVLKEKRRKAKATLYIESAPAGVMGIDALSGTFRGEFAEFVKNELNAEIPPVSGNAPICSVSSVGSIGTIGYKKSASDLDLQIQYELDPFIFDSEQISDFHMNKYANRLIEYFTRRFMVRNKLSPKELKDKKRLAEIRSSGKKNFQRRFPLVYSAVVQKSIKLFKQLMVDTRTHKAFMHELMDMNKMYAKLINRPDRQWREKLLKKKIANIQAYVQKKYPNAEVYLFAYSAEDFRNGFHGTTLESKEASGSAYELILNYEILLPGVQFLPVVPAHFLVPPAYNANRKIYQRLLDYVRFGLIDSFNDHRNWLVDLGATPPLSLDYMIAHSGAIYWEAFKASSGNLPKALLNLLRLEMLFDPKYNATAIEMIKHPNKLNELVDQAQDEASPNNPEDNQEGEETEAADGEGMTAGLPPLKLLEFEKEFPLLLQDPWWLRYKALKIAFGPENENIESEDERNTLSRMIDICFALHVKLSDIFADKDKKVDRSNMREPVLNRLLEKAFPGAQGVFMRQIFIGEVKSVKSFEKILKTLFTNSMERIRQIVEKAEGEDRTDQEELQIWRHYYERNFEPEAHTIHRDILEHLKVPRDRLQIGYSNDKKWFFKALQKRIQTDAQQYIDGDMVFMPDEVQLFEHESFLHGIACCVMNRYYGVRHKGTFKEVTTQLEFAMANISIGKQSADEYAFIKPDNIERLLERINTAFPPIPFDYKSILTQKSRVTDVFVFLSLLEFGRLSFLYQDNFKVWYVEEIDHPAIESKYYDYFDKPDIILDLEPLKKTVKSFLSKIEFVVNAGTIDNVFFWVNPNSVKTSHSGLKQKEKEEELASRFAKIILQTVYTE